MLPVITFLQSWVLSFKEQLQGCFTNRLRDSEKFIVLLLEDQKDDSNNKNMLDTIQ